MTEVNDQRKARKQHASKLRKHRAEVSRKHRVNQQRKRQRDDTLRAVGLFVALLTERGYQRSPVRGVYTKVVDGQTHAVKVEYIAGKAALLMVIEGGKTLVEHVLHYDEQPIARKTANWYKNTKARDRVRRKVKRWEKQAPRTGQSQMQQQLSALRGGQNDADK